MTREDARWLYDWLAEGSPGGAVRATVDAWAAQHGDALARCLESGAVVLEEGRYWLAKDWDRRKRRLARARGTQ